MQRVFLLVLAAITLTGCAPNPWRSSFVANPSVGDVQFEPTDAVTLRAVEWERLEAFGSEARARAIARDLPPDAWPLELRRQEKGEFLRGLRVLEEPEGVILLGSSAFVEPGTIDPYAGTLQQHAASIGAHYAVYSERYVGPRETIESYPMTTWYSDVRTRDGKKPRSGSSTTYVPVVVTRDSFQYVVYYLRRVDGMATEILPPDQGWW
ncbi:MAG: hypothetical protein AAFX05_15040 [Planctomycetota bacterium]